MSVRVNLVNRDKSVQMNDHMTTRSLLFLKQKTTYHQLHENAKHLAIPRQVELKIDYRHIMSVTVNKKWLEMRTVQIVRTLSNL